MAKKPEGKPVGSCLRELIDTLKSIGSIPDELLPIIEESEAALARVAEGRKIGIEAANQSGKSGRPRMESERREAIKFAEGTAAEVAERFKCSPGLVYQLRKEREAEAAAKLGQSDS